MKVQFSQFVASLSLVFISCLSKKFIVYRYWIFYVVGRTVVVTLACKVGEFFFFFCPLVSILRLKCYMILIQVYRGFKYFISHRVRAVREREISEVRRSI